MLIKGKVAENGQAVSKIAKRFDEMAFLGFHEQSKVWHGLYHKGSTGTGIWICIYPALDMSARKGLLLFVKH